ncbi:sensor histidine kinase [Candidatus Methylocalor cossyra]|uniref:histidine kinase n=1 Tax=Candidatus Methylocalor cossyra TaxID=3108543 RepID=A0ABP1C919_9GAMM
MLAFARLVRYVSLRILILLGFTLAIVPLVVTLVAAVRTVDGLALASQMLAHRVAQLSQKNEKLRERLVDFERQAKRHLVLEDADSLADLEKAYQSFVEVLDDLWSLARNADLMVLVDRLKGDGEALYRRLSAQSEEAPNPPGAPAKRRSPAAKEQALEASRARIEKADELFSSLGGQARELSHAVSIVAEEEVKDLETRAQTAQRRMLVEASILLPASLVLISLLTFLIIRSIRQMDFAIRKLGAGDFVRPIKVVGPKDLEYLGERLDWLRSRLRSLEEAKQQFMRHVSHELKTPLATIHEGTELLADEVVGELNTEQRDIANILVSNTQKLDALIAELINYSQVNARPSALRREKVDMGRLVTTVVEDSQIRLRAKSISVKGTIRPVLVEGNPEQLRTIVDNLMSNAIKYSPTGGTIRIGVRQVGGHMELEIEDDGPGIDPEERKQIFEPFFQGKAAREGGIGGTGLGLAILSECVAGHHGKVEALEPRSDKRGARIRVQIPLRQED